MIVKNEELNLGRALASLAGLDAELVVVDTGSTDRTVEIALEHGARVVSFAWVDDFSAARNFAFAHARAAWMLVLDADEAVTPAFIDGVAEVLEKSNAGGVRIPVRCVDDAGRLQQRVSSTRIVRNGHGYAYENRIHEDVEGSILRAGGTLEDAELPIVHRGYTAAENQRKGRFERNLRLTMAAHEASPADPRHWHYLGLELAIAGDYGRAAIWFERVVTRSPEHVLAGWSASQLAAIRVAERAFGAAWDAAKFGTGVKLGRVPSLFLLGDLAVRDGDPETALGCVEQLEKLPSRVEGDVARRVEATLVLRANALAELGSARQAYDLLVRAVRRFPADAAIADALVKVAERIHPGPRAWAIAAKDTDGAPSVLAATIGGLVRVRAWSAAAAIGDRHGLRNEHYSYALARLGRIVEAREVLTSFGDSAAVHRFLVGLERRDEKLVADALFFLPERAAVVAECLFGERPAPRELAWLLMDWLQIALSHRADAVVEDLVRSLPGRPSERAALHALHVYEAGEPMSALRIALDCATEPEGAEVIGLVAFERGDFDAAAKLLLQRVRAGDASVRVLRRTKEALSKIGAKALAGEVLAEARASRPHARAFREAVARVDKHRARLPYATP
ncbi:glycosyltransferase family 2 protein [Labilithrix luteola]|nr:glycosyltransferase family 2 protein [Labilithrix luteola]